MLPLTVREHVVGQLVVGSDRTLRPAERRLAVTATALLSLSRARRSEAGVAERARRQAVAALLDMGQHDAAHRLASRFGLPFLGDHVWLLVAWPAPAVDSADSADSAGAADWLGDAVLRCAPDAYPGPVTAGEPAWFVLPGRPDPDRLRRALLDDGGDASAAVSSAVPAVGLHEVRVGLQARVAALPPGTVDQPPPAATPQVAAGLERLLGYRRADLVGAVAAYLRHRGHWDRAARELRVHRNTLRHRIARCREVSGLDVDDADTAAALWLALRHAGLA
jgi:purine catabolism regulator